MSRGFRAIRTSLEDDGTLVFRVKPDRAGREYFIVRIFLSLRTMRAFHADRANRVMGKLGRARGCCHSFDVWKFPPGKHAYRTRQVGEIHFLRRGLTMRIITHEVIHAGIGWAKRRKRAITDADRHGGLMGYDCAEEQFCRAVSEMAVQVTLVGQKFGWC